MRSPRYQVLGVTIKKMIFFCFLLSVSKTLIVLSVKQT